MEEPFSSKDTDIKQNKCASAKTIIIFSFFIVLIIAIVVILVVFLTKDDKKDKETGESQNTNGDGSNNSDEVEKLRGRTIKFQQPEENFPAKHIIVHIPEKEIFMSTLHPAASLYEDVTDDVKVKKCFNDLKSTLNKKNIELITVRAALKLDKEALKQLASQALKYEIDTETHFDNTSRQYQEFLNYTKEQYKNEVLDKLSEDQLVDVVLNNPKYLLSPTELNTFIEPKLISFSPLGNLIFCRDQQITTQKGVVIARARSSQRIGEHTIMKQVFTNLNSTILGQVSADYDPNAFLEGGDFFVAKQNLSMLGIGLRTTIKGASYLMENDFLGTRYMALIYDFEDLDQQRMHLDTYFNILSDKYVIILDFDEVQTHYPDKKIERKVYLYDNEAISSIESNNTDIPKEIGQYKLIEYFEKLYDFLEQRLNYKLIKVTHQQQVDYIINFLNIGNNEILAVNNELATISAESNTNVISFDFRPILNMYGAMHCITQVSRIE